MMRRTFSRLSLRTQFGLLMLAWLAVVLLAGSIIGRSIVVSQVLNESRSVAQMVEHIGTWGSRYKGVHVRTAGPESPPPGTFLERRAYAHSPADYAALTGMMVPRGAEMPALQRVESYHWKNPALIQREVSDIAAASASPVKFRITAKSVLNPGNAPNDFELEALREIEADFEAQGPTGRDKPAPREYYKVQGPYLLYAKAMMASASCLGCHGSRDAAPAFLRNHEQFNGGGGFGYQEGKPAGVISVSIPLPQVAAALSGSMTVAGWCALLGIVVTGAAILVFVARRVIAPVNELRVYAEALASSQLSQNYRPPVLKIEGSLVSSSNEVHRLGGAVARLGHSLKYLYDRMALR